MRTRRCGCGCGPAAAARNQNARARQLPAGADAPARCAGEKKLRGLLIGSPEWCDVAVRLATAEVADARGADKLANVLRRHDAALLRKTYMLELCALWGYRCDAWARKSKGAPAGTTAAAAAGTAAGAAAAAAAAAAAPAAPAAPAAAPAAPQRKRTHAMAPTATLVSYGAGGASGSGASAGGAGAGGGALLALVAPAPGYVPGAALVALRGLLRARLSAYVEVNRDAGTLVALAAPASPCRIWSLASFDAVLPPYRAFAALTAADALQLALLCDTLAFDEQHQDAMPPLILPTAAASGAPAAEGSAGALTLRADAHFLLMQRMLSAYRAGMHHMGAMVGGAGGLAAMAPLDRAIMCSWEATANALDAFVATCQTESVTARLSARGGPPEDDEWYVRVVAEAMSSVSVVVALLVELHERRRAWVLARAAAEAPAAEARWAAPEAVRCSAPSGSGPGSPPQVPATPSSMDARFWPAWRQTCAQAVLPLAQRVDSSLGNVLLASALKVTPK